YPCLRRAAVPVKRVWLGLRGRLGLRRSTGLGELRREVRTCEYDDVHVMWELLSGMDGSAPPEEAEGEEADEEGRCRIRRVEPPLLFLLRLL
uniref:Uncharacterized protein n=1 Tax=Aegilops tauschii subsp. strangulata TaxID=200361 RepID=A0A453BPE3_AEGTS